MSATARIVGISDAYYRDTATGEHWAVQVTDDGIVLAACGPLHDREVTAANLEAGFNYDIPGDEFDDTACRLVDPPYIGDRLAEED